MSTPHPSHDAAFWDERFRHPEPAYGLEPSRFLEEVADRFTPGMEVLVAADGQCRNGLWAAARGCVVTCADLSPVGLARGREEAGRRGVTLHTLQVDLLTWPWPEGRWDAVIAIYFHILPAHRRRVLQTMLRSLRPGGLAVIEGFHRDQLGRPSGGPRDPEMLFTETMLAEDFVGAEILINRHDRIDLDEGRLHRGPAELVRFLARKPA